MTSLGMRQFVKFFRSHGQILGADISDILEICYLSILNPALSGEISVASWSDRLFLLVTFERFLVN